MSERKMDLDKIVKVAKWFGGEYNGTHLLDISDKSVQTAIDGLSEVAPPESWKWSLMSIETDFPHRASVVLDGVTFYAIFTPEERDEAMGTASRVNLLDVILAIHPELEHFGELSIDK